MDEWLQRFRDWVGQLGALEILAGVLVGAIVLQWIMVRVVLLLARRTKTDLDEQIVGVVRIPLFVTLLFWGGMIALRRAEVSDRTIFLTRATLVTVATLLWLRALMRVGNMMLDVLARRVDDFKWIQPRSLPLYDILTKTVLLGAAIYVVMNAWEKDLTGWLASAGIIGIAVGFAAKDTLANLFAGIFILADAPYKLGDYILLEGGERGRVTDIGIRSTRMLTRDDVEITIPNSVIANSKIVNETGGPSDKRRVRVTVGVAYGSDIDRVRGILMEIADGAANALDHPEPRVRFVEMADSALLFQLNVWVREPALRGRAVDEINTAVYKRFNEEGIEIPFPQRVVHLQRE